MNKLSPSPQNEANHHSHSATEFIPVILSGGSGTRLWPVSRSRFPKQFADLFDESLFTKTVKRLQPLGTPWVVTNETMKVLTEKVLRENQVPLANAIYEPRANNTAPAIALICKILADHGHAYAVAGIFPSDQLVQDEARFQSAIQLAIQCAQKHQVVTLGLKPTFASTGYGYIEVSQNKPFAEHAGLTAIETKGFREKPDEKTAQGFITQGNFFWNAGMFLFQVSDMIAQFQSKMPELWNLLSPLKKDLSNLKEIYEQIASASFSKSCATSIDYGIMEKLTQQVCIPCDLGWSDVGSWDEIARLTPSAPQIQVKSHGNYTFPFKKPGEQKVVSFVGVDDLIVVDTHDALLIAKKGSTQHVKAVTEELIKMKNPNAHDHLFEIRPWGKFEILRDSDGYKSKVIHINPGQQISYQSHNKRSEHWVIISGTAEVTLNEELHHPKPGQSIYVGQGVKHRIRNPHPTEVLEFVEVQVGSYFGEDDIIRYQDDYKRV